jgi:hypothetical protein
MLFRTFNTQTLQLQPQKVSKQTQFYFCVYCFGQQKFQLKNLYGTFRAQSMDL